MKYCKNCGAHVKDNQKVCTQCGHPLQNQNNTSKRNKKMYLVIGIIIAIIILLIILYKIVATSLSPESEAKTISEDLKKGDTKNLSNHLVFNDRSLNKDEAKAFYKYVVDADNPERIADDIENKTKQMTKDKSDTASVDINDTEVIHIHKNGKKYGIFNNYDFEVSKQKVSITPESDSKVTYKYNGKKHKIKLSEDESKTFATLPLGNYKLKAQKVVNNEKFDGQLIITMSDENEVQEQFNEKYLDINIDDSELDSDTQIDLYINNKKLSAQDDYDSYLYGPYKPDEKIEVYAQAHVDDKKFKSNVVKAPKPKKENEPVPIDLSFDNEKIKAHQENKDIKENVQTFIEDYTEDLNEAYEEEEYSYISSYIKRGTDTADHMKKVVESGDEADYSDPKVVKYSKKGDTITIEVEKQDKDDQTIHSQYVLDYDDLLSDFKIKDYTDI